MKPGILYLAKLNGFLNPLLAEEDEAWNTSPGRIKWSLESSHGKNSMKPGILYLAEKNG